MITPNTILTRGPRWVVFTCGCSVEADCLAIPSCRRGHVIKEMAYSNPTDARRWMRLVAHFYPEDLPRYERSNT